MITKSTSPRGSYVDLTVYVSYPGRPVSCRKAEMTARSLIVAQESADGVVGGNTEGLNVWKQSKEPTI